MIYYGQSSCESDLDRYLESLKCLWCRRSQSREMPVIINTMGWVKGQRHLPTVMAAKRCEEVYISLKCVFFLSTGFGFQLLVDIIRLLPVTHVVQLGHGGTIQCPALTPEFLRTAHGYQTHPPAQTALDEFTESHCPPRTFFHLSVQSEFQGVARQGTA